MLLLIVDTSGKNGSVALARAGEDGDQVHGIDSSPLAGGTFSAQLVPQIAELLEKHRFRKTDINAFIVVSGPGSFTGLRVGLAAIKGLAEILGKPIVPVSVLEVLAVAAEKQGRVLALLDAGRGQLYAGEYDVTAGRCERIREHLISKEALAAHAAGVTVSTSDPLLARAAREPALCVVELESVTPEMIACVGWTKLQAGEVIAPEQLDANYVRGSDEIFAKPASS